MPQYRADLGTWEKGRCVRYEAPTQEEAIAKAFELLKENVVDGRLPESDMVVQVAEMQPPGSKREWRVFFDFVNGHMKVDIS